MEKIIKSAAADSIRNVKVNIENLNIGKIELNFLTMLIGANGTGKSFLLVTAFACTEIARLFKTIGITIDIAQFVIDGCYDDKNLTGYIGVDFESGAELVIHLKEGKVISVNAVGLDEIDSVIDIQYMSTQMRTFSAIKNYLFTRKMLMKNLSFTETYAELCKNYKLYDVQYIEKLIQKMPLTLKENSKEALKKFEFKDEIDIIDLDPEMNDFYYVNAEGKRQYFTTFGNGHQSILNMVIGQSR